MPGTTIIICISLSLRVHLFVSGPAAVTVNVIIIHLGIINSPCNTNVKQKKKEINSSTLFV